MEPSPENEIELSIVIPCLNEAETLAICLQKALRIIAEMDVRGEVIVADNGSTDGSVEICREHGVELISIAEPGYGSALMGGIAAARGKFIIMGDADDSYDFLEAPRFLRKLREGFDLVQGCRLPAGGGQVLPGSMPWSHRYLGNPFFSQLVRWWFKAPINDVYCGLRGFKKSHYEKLDQNCTGMEFATEMIIKSSQLACRIAEVPITLHPDGRVSNTPHLRTYRDGWRTLRFFLVNSPRWLFLIPGMITIFIGLLGYGLALPDLAFRGGHPELPTLLFSSLLIMCGFQSVLFALLSKTYAVESGLIGPDPRLKKFYSWATLERGLLAAALAMALGILLLIFSVKESQASDPADPISHRQLQWMIPGVTITALGAQLFLSSFFVSILGIQKKR